MWSRFEELRLNKQGFKARAISDAAWAEEGLEGDVAGDRVERV